MITGSQERIRQKHFTLYVAVQYTTMHACFLFCDYDDLMIMHDGINSGDVALFK